MATVSPMEGVDIAIKIANVVKLFKQRRPGLHALQAMLEEYQQMFGKLKDTDLDQGDVARKVSEGVLRDLKICKDRLDDGSWANKVNLKSAIAEKDDAEAIRKRLGRELQLLHTELMLALQHRNGQQFLQIQEMQDKEARKCNKELRQLQRQLQQMQEEGDDSAEAMERRVDSLKTTLGILHESQAQVLKQGQQHFAALRDNQEQLMTQGHAHMEQNQKHFVALQDSHAVIMKRSEEQFKCLDEQSKQTLKEVREGFVHNKQLQERVMKAVYSGRDNVLQAIHKESQTRDKTSESHLCILLAKLQEVLHAVQKKGVAVMAETVELAMNSEV